MAVGRLSVSAGKKGKGSPHAEYIAREGKYAKPDNDLEKLEFVGTGNMPEWATDKPNFFWKMSDEHERANGTAYREHVISLPRELTADQRHDLIKDWIANEIGDRHAYQYAIHNPPALDGGEQPHCHLMYCERELDGIDRAPDQYFKRYNAKNPERGGARKSDTGMKPAERKLALVAQRARWEDTCNRHLELADTKTKINMKSYAAIGSNNKSLNYDMKDRNKPDVKATQSAANRAKIAYIDALNDRKTVNIREEIGRLSAAAEQQPETDQPFATAGDALKWMQEQDEKYGMPSPYSKPAPKLVTTPDPEPEPEPVRPAPPPEPVAIHTLIPDIELDSYTKMFFVGLHKEHDKIINNNNDDLLDTAQRKNAFFNNAEEFSMMLSSELDERPTRAELDKIYVALHAVAKIINNIDCIESDPVPQRDPAVTAFNTVCATTDAALMNSQPAPVQERTSDNSPRP